MKNKGLLDKLCDVLKQEGLTIINTPGTTKERLEKMDEILKIEKILDNFDELEPVLSKFFEEKHKKIKYDKER